MAAVRLYLDEDVHPLIADALRLRGCEVLTTVEASRRSTGDHEQLDFATANGYAFVTYNSCDLPRIHYEVINAGRTHAGVIIATQDDPRPLRGLLGMLGS